jgi:long-chain acyl-CoA synthetase
MAHRSIPDTSDPLRRSASRYGNRPAVLSSGVHLRYAELDGLADSLAAAALRIGIGGQRVGLRLPNMPAFPAVAYGLMRAGARLVMLNPQYSPRETAEVLEDSAATAVVTTDALRPLLPPGVRTVLLDDLPLAVSVAGPAPPERIPLEPAGAPPVSLPRSGDESVIVYTAATRGRARGARLSTANLEANLRSTVQAMRLTPDDRVLAILPYIHLFGFTVTLNAPLAAGAAVIPVERFNPLRALELLEEYSATVVCGVPGIYAALLVAAERRGRAEHRLRVAISGGSPLALELGRRWEQVFGIPLREGYGLTEASPVCLFNRADRPNGPGTLGFPFPGVEISIRDCAGVDLTTGEVGEICVRGENVFHGYLDEGGRSPSDFHGDWLRTGDLGNFEADGRVRYRGLLKPMFTRSGFNVYPRELQRVLEEDPRIRSVEVATRPDAVKENEILLRITPMIEGAITEAEVRELCKARLAAFKQPERIHFAPLDAPTGSGVEPIFEKPATKRENHEGE